jgi:hypothetical protein
MDKKCLLIGCRHNADQFNFESTLIADVLQLLTHANRIRGSVARFICNAKGVQCKYKLIYSINWDLTLASSYENG